LLFSSFRGIRIKAKVAYAWMWLLPLGCCFLFQASEIGNDLLSATFMLAGFAYALKAQRLGHIRDAWISMLAVALATGVKATALPLVLVWLAVIAPCWRLLFRGVALSGSAVLGTIAVGLIAAMVSFLPTAYHNWKETRDWTGANIEDQPFKTPQIWARMLGGLEMTVVLNLEPPVAPFARAWNERVAPKLTPLKLQEKIQANLQQVDRHPLGLDEMQTDLSGLGMQICVLLFGSAAVAKIRTRRERPGRTEKLTWTQKLVIAATAIAFLAMLKNAFVLSIARLIAPFYPFFAIPFLLHPGQERVVRGFGWRVAVIAAACLTALPVLIRPERPLVPMRQILSALHRKYGDRPAVIRAQTVYEVYAQRSEAFAPAVAALPPDARVLGLVTYDDPETSLWKPFGSRRIVHVCPGDSADRLKARGVQYVLTGPLSFHLVFPTVEFDDWLRQVKGTVIQTIPLRLRAGEPPTIWSLVKLN
jgi:hypothetical protein